MVNQGTAAADLKQAIAGVDAMLDEARRELNRKEHTKRRAAFEALHAALAAGQEEGVEQAIREACDAGVDAEDIGKASAFLADLRSVTPEQRAAKAKMQVEADRKREAFQLAKKDLADSLAELLDGLEEGTRWQEWRDYSGRTLHHLATELRSTKVMEMLRSRCPVPPKAHTLVGHDLVERLASLRRESEHSEAVDAATPAGRARSTVPACGIDASSSGSTATSTGTSCTASSPDVANSPSSAGDAELSQARAMRAVVQDDTAILQDILAGTPIEVWSRWENKAGKDMLTLAEERGSSNAYCMLAKALGLVQELKREVFEERESVWVFMPGDVQACRATVLEDVPEEADEILVEFWDGEEEPRKVKRCQVRKTAS